MKFPEAIVEVLSRRHSDHNPLLLRCGGYPFRRGDRPFRFEVAWCTHEGYVEVVRKAWERGNGDVAKSLDYVRQDSMVFNKEVFGNTHTRKKALESRLRGIERTLERVDSLRLLHNYHELSVSMNSLYFRRKPYGFKSPGKIGSVLAIKIPGFFIHKQ
uniref:Uncharacterized protein n=1 Tax=Cajanus cajan TaxID=3821 RepID=A0A151T5C8_CAJCA|nr:hypothetical protein KK1_016785 [Cajanus cajan]